MPSSGFAAKSPTPTTPIPAPSLFVSKLSSKVVRKEPSFFEKFGRRISVFWLAAQVFIDYKITQRKETKLKRQLGINEEDDEDDEDGSEHPSIVKLWDDVHARNAAKLTQSIKQLEGFWVKVGQYLSSRADIMPPVYLKDLSTLQDSMPPKPFQEEILRTLQEELSEDDLAMIDHIDPVPLSTASLAQVHRARLVSGRDVVLKVQHRGVASLMRQDMNNLRSILEFVGRFEPDADFRPVIQEYNQEVRKELDFRIEADNMEEIRHLLEDHRIKVIVPKSIPELVKERVLVMDFCQGFAVRNIDALDEHRVDRELLLQRVCQAWAVQLHVAGVFNADPHSGNILVSTDYTPDNPDRSVPVLLDFGLTKRLKPDIRVAFARLMHASYETDVDAMIQSFDEMGLKMNRYDPFEDMAAMQRSFGSTVPQSEVKQTSRERSVSYKKRMEAMREDQGLERGQKLRNPVDAWPAELVFFGRVTNMLKGLCSRLEVRHPYLETMALAARTTLQESIPVEKRAKELIYPDLEESISTRLQARLVEAVRQLEKDNEMVGLQLCVMQNGTEVASVAAGCLGTADPRPVTPSTLFNIFSVGKALLTVGLLRLLQDKEIELDEPVAKYWPAFGDIDGGGFDKNKVTIRHVLCHQAGLSNAIPGNATLDTLCDFALMKRFMETAKSAHEPGTQTQYHYLTFAWICGGIIEEVTGLDYDVYLDKILSEARSSTMNQLGLYTGGISKSLDSQNLAVLSLEKSPQAETEPTGPKHTEGVGVGAEHSNDSNGKEMSRKSILAKYRGREQLLNPSVFNMKKVRQSKIPSANIHASAQALAVVFDAIVCQNSAILSSETVDLARNAELVQHSESSDSGAERALLVDAPSFGLGFQVHEFGVGFGRKGRSIGHAGFGGSVLLAIPEKQLSVALVTNRLSPKSLARSKLLNIIWDEFGLQAPATIDM